MLMQNRLIGFFLLFLLGLYGCNSTDCGDAPAPLSLNFQWVNTQGQDIFSKTNQLRDSVETLVITKFDSIKTKMSYRAFKDSSVFYFDALPTLRKSSTNKQDTFYVKLTAKDTDTIVAIIEKVAIECYTHIYKFKELQYNGEKLSGTDSLYTIKK